MNDTSTILCSGIALGVYTPALLFKKNIENEHKTADIVALESIFLIEKQEQLQRNKILFHQNFKLAKLAHRLPPAMSQHYDKQKVEHLMEKWLDEKRFHFTVFSGFWIPLLEDYIAKSGREDIAVECIHMDAGLSPSWKPYAKSCDIYHNIWLWGDECIKTIPAGSDFEILAYEQRENRLIVHGGGWGMGNFKEKVSCLANCEYELDIVKYEMVEEDESDIDYYRIDPAWVPWESYEFPPMLYGNGNNMSKMDARNYHNMLEISRCSKGIVSKPGGATLLDSILSATPLIMLEPLGEHEKRNAEIWKKYGFGISVEEWEKSHFSNSILSELHNNLMGYQEKIKPIEENEYVTTKTSKKLDEDCLNRLKKTIKHMSKSRKSILNDPSYCTDLPVEIGLKLTNGCNLRCKHCFEWNDEGFHRDMDLQEQRAQLDINIIKKILKQTQSVKSNLYLWGGEPLIYNKWNELVDLLTADPRWTVLCTNGLLIENKIESLLQISENLACLISLEGFEEENDRIRGKGTFQNVMRNIDLLLDLQRKGTYKGRVSVHMTVSEYMIDKLYDFVDFFEKKDIDTLYLTLPWYLPEEVSNEMDQYYNKNFKWLANNIDEHHRYSWHSFKFKLEPEFVEPLIQQMEQINQKNWSIRVRYQPGIETNQVKDYIVGSNEPVRNKEKCLALNSRMDVLADGKVTACKHFSELAVADLNIADDIKAVWQGEEFNEVRKTINCGLMPVCSKCILLYLNGN